MKKVLLLTLFVLAGITNTVAAEAADQEELYTIKLQAYPAEAGEVYFTGCGGGGANAGETEAEFAPYEVVALGASGNLGYQFVNWTVDGEELSNDRVYSFHPTKSMTLVANFEKVPTYTIALQANPANGGNVFFTRCGDYIGEEAKEVMEGEYLEILALPNEEDGYEFVNWTLDNTQFSSSQQDYFQAKKSMTLVANFKTPEQTIYSVRLDTDNGETSVFGEGGYIENQQVTIRAQEEEFYTFKHWEANEKILSTELVYTFILTQDTSIKAVYTRKFSVEVEVTPEDAATITGTGIFKEGTTATLTATPSAGYVIKNWFFLGDKGLVEVATTAEYSFQVTDRTYLVASFVSTNADLISLSVDPGTLNIPFSSSTAYYTVNVANGIDKITLTPETADNRAGLRGNFGEQTLEVGKNTFSITVTAEDGITTKTYTIDVIRQSENPNTNATLKSLTVSHATLQFSPNTIEYTINVTNSIDKITLAAETADENATLIGTGEQTLEVGKNTFSITVTAEDGITTKTYTIDVIRQSENPNTNANLKSLTVSHATLEFSPKTIKYTINVTNSIDKITLAAETADENATLIGTGEQTLEVGKNTFSIAVTAEDGVTTKTYTIEVIRQSLNPSNDATLKSLTLSHGVLDPVFSPATTTYTVEVENTVTTHTVTAEANHALATVNGHGERTLQTGENKAEITVTAEDGVTKKTYTVTITRKKSGINKIEKKSTVKVYPNPTTGIVNIETQDGTIPTVEVYTTNGLLLQKLQNKQVDISAYPVGTYILHINGKAVKIVKK